MAKVLVLGKSGFGKTTSIGNIPEYNIQGLTPEKTFVISATSKPLPFKGSAKTYQSCNVISGIGDINIHRLITNNGAEAASAIEWIIDNRPDIKNIVIDDANYFMQDYYMDNSLRKGYDVFKEIGVFINKLFAAMEKSSTINFYMLAHYEEYKDSSSDSVSYRFKTVGSMVESYITPEGKFDIVLYGKQYYDEITKKTVKQFITNFDGKYPAKSPIGMFDEINIPNDLGYVAKKVYEYYN